MPPATCVPQPQRPLDALFRPATLIAAVLAGEALAALLALSPAPVEDRLVLFGLLSMGIQWTALGTLGVLYVFRRPLGKLQPQALTWACLGTLLLLTLLIAAAAWQLFSFSNVADRAERTAFLLRSLALALTTGLLVLLAFQNHWRARQLAVRAKQAELDALQARIHPHFLFNTLNTGVALVHQQPEKAEQLLLDLADLFRAALAGPNRIPLREEMELARRYAEIEQLRFGPRMQLEWELSEPLPTLQVPTLSIQPLLENAIHHGVEPSTRSCLLRVIVEHTADQARITLINDLPATPGPARSGHGVGLRAVRERVQAMGGQVETRIEGGRYMATVTLPCPAQ